MTAVRTLTASRFSPFFLSFVYFLDPRKVRFQCNKMVARKTGTWKALVGKTSFPKQNSSIRSSRTFLAVEGKGGDGNGIIYTRGRGWNLLRNEGLLSNEKR
jgi:hypothetical protein